jgi:hypothetical protein
MPRVLELIQMPNGKLGVVLDMPLDARSSVSLWTAEEHDRAIANAVRAERAAILELVESFVRSWNQDDVTSWHEAANRIAAAINARGTE